MKKKQLESAGESGVSLPVVAGRMECSIAEHERACLCLIRDEQEKPSPDNHLITVLCDSVRMGRELVERVSNAVQLKIDSLQSEIEFTEGAAQSERFRQGLVAEQEKTRQYEAENEELRDALEGLLARADAGAGPCDWLKHERDMARAALAKAGRAAGRAAQTEEDPGRNLSYKEA